MKWQTIETAPKDGKDILLYDASFDKGILLGGWLDRWWWVEGGQITANPTHWMPLPNPPKE